MRLFAKSFLVFLLVLFSLNTMLAQTATDPKPAAPTTAAKVVNINTATQAELDALPGIGPSLAKRIIDFRTKNGNFKAPADLMAVSGIGEKKFEQLKSLITVK